MWFAVTMTRWLWQRNAEGTARFTLATLGKNPLVCVGINPSTAVPDDLDRTVNRVNGFASSNGFDSWTMLNVYPQIATDPLDIAFHLNPALKNENERHVGAVLAGRRLTVLAAWGDLIESRDFLKPVLADLLTVMTAHGCDWVNLGTLTKKGHPRHPLYVAGTTPFVPFDVDAYRVAKGLV